MTPDDLTYRVEALLESILDLSPTEQQAVLAQRRSEDAEVCARVEALLADAQPEFLNCRAALPPLEKWFAREPPSLPPGTRLEDYDIEAEIGRGGMAVVYRARQRSLNRVVALKFMLLTGQLASAEEVKRFRTEAEAVARLQHPNIVQIHAISEWRAGGVNPPMPFLALEYVDGGTLSAQLAGRPLPPREAAQLTATLAQAMDHAHQRGIVHLDLKPANILLAFRSFSREPQASADIALSATSALARGSRLNDEITPKIADFGLARQWVDGGVMATASGVIRGTPSYMAPEQATESKTREIGQCSDVYALGAILYELLSGRPPFRAESTVLTLKQVVEAEPARPRLLNPAVPRDLDTICLKCLEKEPRQRYTSAAALADDLRRFLEGRPIQARPTPLWERGWRWCRRNPWRAGFGGVAVAAVVLLVLYLRGALLIESQRRQHAEQILRNEQQTAYREGITAARAAAARGEWRIALGLYERLIPSTDAPDRQHLEVERLPGFLAVNDRDRFAQEVTRLAGRDDLGPDAAQVKLLLGEFYLCQPARQEEAHRLVDDALAIPGQLSDSDRAYAQALIVPSSNRLTTLLKNAIAQAPFHHRANRAYLMARILRGEFPEAHQQVDFMRRYFRDDPLIDYADALLTILEGDRAAGLAKLAPLDQKLGPEHRAAIAQYLGKLADLLDRSNLPDASGRPKGLLGQGRALRELTNPGLEPLTLSVPTAALLVQTLEQIAQAEKALRQNKLQVLREESQRLAAISQESPEGLFLGMRAVLHLRLAMPLLDAGRMTEARAELQTMLDLSRQAATAPTLLPRSPLRYQERVLALLASVSMLRGAIEPTPVQIQRFREDCTRIITEGLVWPDLRRDGVGIVCQMITLDLTPKQLKEWHLDQPAGRARYAARMRFLYDSGRRVLEDWQQDDPKNPMPLLRLAELELKAKRPEAALQAARQALVLSPGHKEALKLEQQSLRGLREQTRE